MADIGTQYTKLPLLHAHPSASPHLSPTSAIFIIVQLRRLLSLNQRSTLEIEASVELHDTTQLSMELQLKGV